MGLLDGIRVLRSSDPIVRRAACDVADFFVDVPFDGEIVRARCATEHAWRFADGAFKHSHEGGTAYVTLPAAAFSKDQISPTRDTRLRWMQSVVHCTHYIAGAGRKRLSSHGRNAGNHFCNREAIERSDEAYTEIPS